MPVRASQDPTSLEVLLLEGSAYPAELPLLLVHHPRSLSAAQSMILHQQAAMFAKAKTGAGPPRVRSVECHTADGAGAVEPCVFELCGWLKDNWTDLLQRGAPLPGLHVAAG